MNEIVSYIRVRTHGQGFEGLGMSAQRATVVAYAEKQGATIIGSYEEVETARRDSLRNRPQLRAALGHARRSGATLVIARIDRLARSVLVTAELLASGVDFIACDNPHANRFTIHVLAALAEHESRMISERVKAAFAAKRARGDTFKSPNSAFPAGAAMLGTRAANAEAILRSREIYADLVPIVRRLRSEDMSVREVARALNEMGHRTQRGTPWSVGTVYAFLNRESLSCAPPKWWSGSSALRRSQILQTQARSRPIIQFILSERNVGSLYHEIAHKLNATGSRTPRGLMWNAASINNIMSRRGVNHRSSARGS